MRGQHIRLRMLWILLGAMLEATKLSLNRPGPMQLFQYARQLCRIEAQTRSYYHGPFNRGVAAQSLSQSTGQIDGRTMRWGLDES